MVSSHVSNGPNKFKAVARDPMAGTSSSEHGEGEISLKVDTQAPHSITISGLASKGAEYELGEVEAHLKVEATDGETYVPSSGIRSIGLEIDGKSIGFPGGSCSPGICTASAEWTLNGAELGSGVHIFNVVATDNAGNVEKKEFIVSVYHASPVAMGPGSVNPESGDFALGATDVDLSGSKGSLTLSRRYDSRNVAEGAEGSLGPEWTLSLGSVASLEVQPDESVLVIGPEGLTHFSKKTGGGFEAPTGDSNLKLEKTGTEYIL